MARTRIDETDETIGVGFRIPEAAWQSFERAATATKQTRSDAMRDMIAKFAKRFDPGPAKRKAKAKPALKAAATKRAKPKRKATGGKRKTKRATRH